MAFNYPNQGTNNPFGGDSNPFGGPQANPFGGVLPPHQNGGMQNGDMNSNGMHNNNGMQPPPPGGMQPPPPGGMMAPPPPGGTNTMGGGGFVGGPPPPPQQSVAPPPPPPSVSQLQQQQIAPPHPPGNNNGYPQQNDAFGQPQQGGGAFGQPQQFGDANNTFNNGQSGMMQTDAFGNPVVGMRSGGMMGAPPPPGQQQPPPGGPGGMMGGGGIPPPGQQQTSIIPPGGAAVPGMNQPQIVARLLQQSEEFNCGSHFIRPTINRIPQSSGTKTKLGVPIGAIISPMANGIEPIKVVEPQHQGPGQASIVRCRKCRTYMNPYVQWESNGRKWICNMCRFTNETAQSYYAQLDQNGQRTDLYQKPELCNGAVEFIATGDYMVRAPQPPVYMFLLDTTLGSVQSGYLEECCNAIKNTINTIQQSSEIDNNSVVVPGSDRTLVSIMTFDSSLHFYNMDPSLSSAQMVVVSDLDDLFLPLPDDILINLSENLDQLCNLLDTIPSLFSDTRIQESCLGTAIKGAYLAMKHIGGKILTFCCTIPTLGNEGNLKPGRNNPSLQQKAEEIELLKPLTKDYQELASKLIHVQMSCDLFVAAPYNNNGQSSTYFDLASVKMISQDTGGEVRFYDNFRRETHGKKLREEVKHVITRFTGWESVMRVRVSKGWRITHFFGHLFVRGQDLLTMPNCNSDYNFAITIEMEEGVSVVDNQCFIQAALLYTNDEAERRIRVLTYSIVASNSQQELVQSVDPIATSSILSHMAIDRATRLHLNDARQWLTSQCQHIMASSSHIQDQGNFCFLPLYVFGILRCPALRIGPGPDLRYDARTANWTRLATISCNKHQSYFVPRLIPLHNLEIHQGQADANGMIVLPDKLPLSGNELSNQGAYLIENGESMICYVGQEIDPSWLQNVWGVGTVNELPIDGTIPEEDLLERNGNNQKDQFLNIIDAIRSEQGSPWMSFHLTIQGRRDYLESRFWEMLIEDKSSSMNLSYAEFADRMKRVTGAVQRY